jgi:hypothetical protein
LCRWMFQDHLKSFYSLSFADSGLDISLNIAAGFS